MGIKVGIISDTHLGVSPLDQELNLDSFEAFEEGLKLLVSNGADIILHAGDFYDRTDPPPWVQDKTTKILRRTITGKKPSIEVIEGIVNFQAEDVSIAVPIFAIHGTHDRPVGKPTPAPAFQHLVAAGYLNYVDADDKNDFADRKIVLKKGSTIISITGIGHRAEGDINASIKKSGVPSTDKAINLCCVHNCIEGITPSSGEYLDLGLFEDIDYVIAGHAHQASLDNNSNLIVRKLLGQSNSRTAIPGSSTETGIYQQEEGNKFVHLLDFNSKSKLPMITSFPLKSVRKVFCKSVFCQGLTAKLAVERINN